MGNIFTGLGDIPENKINSNAEVLKAYEECHAKLLRDYNSEISEIINMLSEIRRERMEFYEIRLPEIKKAMREDNVSDEAIDEWIEILKDNMENSLRMSEAVVKSFWIDTKKEFLGKLYDEIERV